LTTLSLLDGYNMGFINAQDLMGNMMTEKMLGVLLHDPLGELFELA